MLKNGVYLLFHLLFVSIDLAYIPAPLNFFLKLL
jgi:hypothetical protein